MSQTAPRRPTSVKKTIQFPRLERDEGTGVETRTVRELTLVFDFSAIAALEDLYDVPLKEIGEKFKQTDNLRIRDVQRMLYAGLRTHHAEITLDAVMILLNEAVGAGVSVGDVMTQTFSAFDAGAGQDGKPGADPQKAG
jgi:hypothetical protein